MSNPTTPFNWQMPTNTDLVTDLPADFEVFGQAVASSMADLLGGTTGQILSKATNADMDFTWIDNQVGDITSITATTPLTGGGTGGDVTVGIQAASTSQSGAVQLTDSTSSTSTTTAATPNSVKSAYDLANAAVAKSIVDAKGDLIAATAADTVSRLAVGTNNQVLTADSSTATGMKWATPATGGGKVGQVLSTLKTDTFSTTSTSSTTVTGLSVTITPSASTSKIMIIASVAAGITNVDSHAIFLGLSGGNTASYIGDAASNRRRTVHWVRRPGDSATVAATNMPMTMVYLDSPATTSATTYNVTAGVYGGTGYVNRSGIDTDDLTWGRSASTITVMEILA